MSLHNLALMTIATGGTGAIRLAGAATVNGVPYLTFAQAGVTDGETLHYSINDVNGSEVGSGVWTAATKTLTRTVVNSTNSNNPINVSASALVAITPLASDLNFQSLVVGSTPITGGTNGRILYDNAGFLGELAPAALTKTDDTNVTLTLGGTPATALLQATSLTLGWTGTLAAARLNSNVVQAVSNDTNVTGSIATQTLTLGWTGQLSLARGGTNANLTASNGGIFYSTGSAGAILAGTATARQMLQSGASGAPAWSTATWPATTTINQILYSSTANVVAGLATANSSVLVTDSGGIPSLSTTLPSGVLGPTSTTVGNIAFWNSTTGTKLAAAPAFQAGNPANAALYSQMANIANGYTTIYNMAQFSLGAAIDATGQFLGNTAGVQQALVGTLSIASGDTAGNAGYGVIGYGNSNSATTGVVGVGGIVRPGTSGSGTSLWASHFGASNATGIAAGTGLDLNWLAGNEINVVVKLKSGSVEPTIGSVYGIYLVGSGDSTTNQGVGISVNQLSNSTNAKWTVGFESTAGAAVNGMRLGPTAISGANLASQPIILRGTDGASALTTTQLYADGSAALIINPSSGKTAIGPNTLTPDATLTINQNTVASAIVPTGGIGIHVIGSDTNNTGYQVTAAVNSGGTAGPLFSGRISRGTLASKSAVQSGDFLATFQGQGYDTSTYATGARIQFRPTETWSTSAHGGRIAFAVVANTTTTVVDSFYIQNSGGVAVGVDADPGAGLIYTNSATFMIRTKTSYTNGAGVGAGTLGNAPAAGNPTKWIPVDDNGTTRQIPAW